MSVIEKTYLYINSKNTDAVSLIGRELSKITAECFDRHSSLVILCIGTDRATGDSLGPLTGSNIARNSFRNVSLYGTLDSPVHALNLTDTLKKIYALHKNPFIIAVDASLGNSGKIGYLRLEKGPLRPGLSLNKKLPLVGDIHITGVVNFSGTMELLILQTTKLSTVLKMSEVLSQGICSAISQLIHQSVI